MGSAVCAHVGAIWDHSPGEVCAEEVEAARTLARPMGPGSCFSAQMTDTTEKALGPVVQAQMWWQVRRSMLLSWKQARTQTLIFLFPLFVYFSHLLPPSIHPPIQQVRSSHSLGGDTPQPVSVEGFNCPEGVRV